MKDWRKRQTDLLESLEQRGVIVLKKREGRREFQKAKAHKRQKKHREKQASKASKTKTKQKQTDPRHKPEEVL